MKKEIKTDKENWEKEFISLFENETCTTKGKTISHENKTGFNGWLYFTTPKKVKSFIHTQIESAKQEAEAITEKRLNQIFEIQLKEAVKKTEQEERDMWVERCGKLLKQAKEERIKIRQEARQEVIEEILNKINKDYKKRDITICELGAWLEKLKSQNS